MLEILPTLEENSFDSCVTDPPYHLQSIGHNRPIAKRGLVGMEWDGGDVAFRPGTWAEIYRVLKPGAFLVAFSGTRTYHRIACAVEDAGFDIRDQLAWVYGTGFPKSLDVSKAIDKIMGRERVILSETPAFGGICGKGVLNRRDVINATYKVDNGPVSNEAIKWEGWGTALKPAWEPIVFARKPLEEKTVAAQVLETGTGALNIDACRIQSVDSPEGSRSRHGGGVPGNSTSYELPDSTSCMPAGHWPANILHDESEEVVEFFPNKTSRFFYSAKANAKDRAGSKHPTVKPVSLMEWLCSLVTQPGGIVLDPFAGSGTTGIACKNLGFNCTLIEREKEYIMDIYNRFENLQNEEKER